MRIEQAIAIAKHDEHRLIRFIERRGRFLDALDWDALPDQIAREASMLDDLVYGEGEPATCFFVLLEGCVAMGVEDIVGVVRFEPGPRPWQIAWVNL